MTREAVLSDLNGLLALYLHLHEDRVPEDSEALRATACLNRARQIAAEAGCYKMTLMTGSKSADTLEFYRKRGYNDADKTALIQWL